MYPFSLNVGSFSTFSLHIFLLVKTSWKEKSCCPDGYFDLRINNLIGQPIASVSVNPIKMGTANFNRETVVDIHRALQ
jgi:hypothetical protein